MMKIALPVTSALLLLAVAGWAQPSAAQGAPPGSYLGSCTNVSVRGDRLGATCRRRDGREQRVELFGFQRCVGDIGNNNGLLQCNTPGGIMYGQVVARGGPPAPAPAPYGAPPPAYGYRGPQGAGWERCQQLDQRVEELRYRRDQAWDPGERANLDGRLREVYRERRQAGCR